MDGWDGLLQALGPQLGPYLPRVLGAAALLLAAWLLSRLARLARTAVQRVGLARGLDERLRTPGVTALLANIAHWTVRLLALPALLGALELEGLLAPVNATMARLLGVRLHLPGAAGVALMPRLISAAIIVVIGIILGCILAGLVTALLAGLGLNRLPGQIGLGADFRVGGRDLAELAGGIAMPAAVLLAAVLLAVTQACEVLGFAVLTEALAVLGGLLARLVVALAAAGGASGASLPCAGLAQRSRRALTGIADAAHALRRDDAPEALEMPLHDGSDELRHARRQEQRREVAVAAERNRIARDLRDAVSQTLFAANVPAGTLARSAGREPPPAPQAVAAQAQALETLNRGALAEMRLPMFELRPDALPGTPLAELLRHAVEALASRGDISVDAELAAGDTLAPEVRVQLYRIAQVALSNVACHSGAQHCRIEWVAGGPRQALLRISDDGRGFEVDAARPGRFGLENMRSRAQDIGATLTLTNTPGQGSEVRVEYKENPA